MEKKIPVTKSEAIKALREGKTVEHTLKKGGKRSTIRLTKKDLKLFNINSVKGELFEKGWSIITNDPSLISDGVLQLKSSPE